MTLVTNSAPGLAPAGLRRTTGPAWGRRAPVACRRRFHLINVSLPKTGTMSIAGLFRRYRAAHEFMFVEAAEAIHDFRRGRLDDAGLGQFVRFRDAAGRLEVDSASFNHWYAASLVASFPDARFLLLFREPVAWVESMLGQYWAEYLLAGMEERPYPVWIRQIGELMMGPFEPRWFRSRESLLPALPALVQVLLGHWRQVHEMLLELLPPERRLVMETATLSCSLPRLAAFVAVPLTELDRTSAHLHLRASEGPLLSNLDQAWLRDSLERECGGIWRRLQRSA